MASKKHRKKLKNRHERAKLLKVIKKLNNELSKRTSLSFAQALSSSSIILGIDSGGGMVGDDINMN